MNSPRLAENYSIELRADSPRTGYLPPQPRDRDWDREDGDNEELERYPSSNIVMFQQQNFVPPPTVTVFEPVNEYRQIRPIDQQQNHQQQQQQYPSVSSPERRREEYENLRGEFEEYPQYYRNFNKR